jgi:hypothetical protein
MYQGIETGNFWWTIRIGLLMKKKMMTPVETLSLLEMSIAIASYVSASSKQSVSI